jgi:tight adherence protein B
MPPVALFLAFVVHKAGPLLVEFWAANRRKKITEQTATAARGLAAQVRVGVTLGEALAAVARETPDPFGRVLKRVTAQLEQGQDVREVLATLKKTVRVDAVALMSAALLVAAEKGGKLAEVLNRISGSLDELARVTRKRDVDTAAGRLMVLLMSLFPVGFIVMLCVMDPDMNRNLFNHILGQVVLAVVGLLVYASVRWASRILAKVE